MKKDIEVIKYLLDEMEEAIKYKEYYDEHIEYAKEKAKERKTWLGKEIRLEFSVEKQPDCALIKQNSKKIRKILLNLY